MTTTYFATWRFELALYALLAKVTLPDVEVSGNENLNLTSSSANSDHSMRKGKSPMNEAGEEQLMGSELQNLKLHDNTETISAHNTSDIPDMVIPQDSTAYSIEQVITCSNFCFCSICCVFLLLSNNEINYFTKFVYLLWNLECWGFQEEGKWFFHRRTIWGKHFLSI